MGGELSTHQREVKLTRPSQENMEERNCPEGTHAREPTHIHKHYTHTHTHTHTPHTHTHARATHTQNSYHDWRKS